MEKGLDPVFFVPEGGACESCGFRSLPGLEMAETERSLIRGRDAPDEAERKGRPL